MLISAHAFGGVLARALSAVLANAEPCVTQALLTEYREVPPRLLADKKITQQQMQALVSGIASFVAAARFVEATEPVALCRDPEEDMLLECCRAARSTVLITGDSDLLALAKPVRRISGMRRLRILSPRAYIAKRPPAQRR